LETRLIDAEHKVVQPTHLERLHDWLSNQNNMKLLRVSYNDLLEQPATWAERICQFLDGRANMERMIQTVDPSLYRNRNTSCESPAGSSAAKISTRR
jgi:hypothetical protein